MAPSAGLIAAVALVAATGAASLGCTETCDRPATEEPIAYHGGSVEGGWYMSANWNEELLHFPGGAYYEIYHQLGVIPRIIQVYVSFERKGTAEGSVAPAAGNQAEIKEVDGDKLWLLNGTCTESWALVVAGPSTCLEQYTHAAIQHACSAPPTECAFAVNTSTVSCADICTASGGECIGYYFDEDEKENVYCTQGTEGSCADTGDADAICVCSRGCGSAAACAAPFTCSNGDCI